MKKVFLLVWMLLFAVPYVLPVKSSAESVTVRRYENVISVYVYCGGVPAVYANVGLSSTRFPLDFPEPGPVDNNGHRFLFLSPGADLIVAELCGVKRTVPIDPGVEMYIIDF
ncbi:hypothetical protein [Alistipes sp.]|uniref:hypothetical protein n=1 Tax=Alistipes sp. TaxID=1872444 RepID=UPI003AEF213A